jgi:RND family efflux transporter MFP subunit
MSAIRVTAAWRVLLIGSLATVLTGCAEEEVIEAGVQVRPVKTIVVGDGAASGIRNFPGKVDALRRVDLAFRVSGTLKELPVKENDEVTRGQTVAALDPADFRTRLADREATFGRLERDYARAQELIKENFISRSDFDRIEADYRSAKAALDQARLDLSYTELKAPFDGIIARRAVQNFEEVQAKQAILALRDLSLLEVKFGVPEGIVQRLTETPESEVIPVTATFDSAPDQAFALTFREFANTADPATQTFEATFVLPRPEGLEVLPGMTANVSVDLSAFFEGEAYFVPVTAVTADPALGPHVWVVDERTGQVSARPVTLGRMSGASIEVFEGINPGERVVTAGTGYLGEGMQVELLPSLEQAEDNIPRSAPTQG